MVSFEYVPFKHLNFHSQVSRVCDGHLGLSVSLKSSPD